MADVLVILPAGGCRRWQVDLAARLTAAGHDVLIEHGPAVTSADRGPQAILAMESRRFGPSPAGICEPLPETAAGHADLVIDLTANSAKRHTPVLTLAFCGRDSFLAGLTEMVATGQEPELVACLDGVPIACGRPMIQDRLWLTRASENLLAGAVSLIIQAVGKFLAGDRAAVADIADQPRNKSSFARHYPFFLAKGATERIARKIGAMHRPIYWQVAYRFIEGPGIAETGKLDGPPFQVLPDDGNRFYADPFVIERGGRVCMFVEEFHYRTGRGVISVSELQDDGTFGTPRVVLKEPHHLSYPQVFAQDGEIYMIPESAAARELVLYRARRFPDVWERDTVLLEDRDVNDATLVESGGRFWLICTQRWGYGSASDTMTVYSAEQLRGPWIPHALNPIAIHHSATRPGGAFIRSGENTILPVQDGSRTYGGGLGLMRLERLDRDAVDFCAPHPVLPGPAWARKGIHTLNRVGAVEVIDSCG